MKPYAVSNLPDEHIDSDHVLEAGKAAKSADANVKKSEINEGGQKIWACLKKG